jgi:hypothetical protein
MFRQFNTLPIILPKAYSEAEFLALTKGGDADPTLVL